MSQRHFCAAWAGPKVCRLRNQLCNSALSSMTPTLPSSLDVYCLELSASSAGAVGPVTIEGRREVLLVPDTAQRIRLTAVGPCHGAPISSQLPMRPLRMRPTCTRSIRTTWRTRPEAPRRLPPRLASHSTCLLLKLRSAGTQSGLAAAIIKSLRRRRHKALRQGGGVTSSQSRNSLTPMSPDASIRGVRMH